MQIMSLQYHVCYSLAALVMIIVSSSPISALALNRHDISNHLPSTATLITLQEYIPTSEEDPQTSFSDGTKWNGLSSVKSNHVVPDHFVSSEDVPVETKSSNRLSFKPPMLRREKSQVVYENVKRDDWEIIEENEFEGSLAWS